MPSTAVGFCLGFHRLAPWPDPHCSSTRAPGSPDEAPKVLSGKERFISGFPEAVCHPTEQWRPQMGCWQSTVTREDALHLSPPFPPCWGTHSAKKPGLSTVLPVTKAEPWPQAPTPAWDFWISDLPRLPQVPSDALLPPCALWVPGCSADPSSASGTPVPIHSPNNLRASQTHCGLTSSRAPSAHMSSFCPKTHPLSSREQQVLQG